MEDKNKPKNKEKKTMGIIDKFKNIISGLVGSKPKTSAQPITKNTAKKEEIKIKKPEEETKIKKIDTEVKKAENIVKKKKEENSSSNTTKFSSESSSSGSTSSEDSGGKLREKFNEKKKFEKKKSFSEIAAETEEKIKAKEGKAFVESDDVINEKKRVEAGFESHIKKKTMKSLEGKVFLVRGKDNGRPAWHYVLVPHDKIKGLRQQKSGTNIDVADYGKIIKSGWGVDPSPEIVKEIEEKYGD